MIGEEYFTLMLDRIKPEEAIRAVAQRYTEAHGQPPRKVLLNPHANGSKVTVVLQVAEDLGLEVERDPSVLKWEVWIGG